MTASSRAKRSRRAATVVAAAAVWLATSVGPSSAQGAALRLRASFVGAPADTTMTVDLFRWSDEAERAALLATLMPPPPPPAAPVAPEGGRAGRGGRGGRGAAPPPSPAQRFSAGVKAAPTVGFIWGDGPTGYSIRYARRSPLLDGREQVVLVTDRRLGAHATSWPVPPGVPDAEFTVIELRIDGGIGEGKASSTAALAVDESAKALALDGYEAMPVLLEVTR